MLTAVKNQLKVWLLSIKYSIIRTMVNKKSFLFSVVLMFISNASFLVQWIVILSASNSTDITMKHILLVWGFCGGAVGLANIFLGGVNSIPEYIIEGKLDAYIVQPKNILLSVASSRSGISALGDFIYGVVVVLIASPSIKTLILFLIFSILGAICYASFITIIYSLIFFSINLRELARVLSRISIAFGTYPDTIFSGGIKILLYTLFPVGAMIYLPTWMILKDNYMFLLLAFIYTIVITLIAFVIFYTGLKKYSSSNLMGART